MRLNYIGRRTAIAMLLIGLAAIAISVKKAMSADLECNTVFIRFCPDEGGCMYFPDRGRFIIADGRATISGRLSTGIPVQGTLSEPLVRPNKRWTIVSRKVSFPSQNGTLTLSEDSKKSVPTHFSLLLPNIEEIGFCH